MFRSKLLWRLYIGFATILFISTVIVGITLSRQLSENTLEEIQNSLSVRSEMLSEIAEDFFLTRPDSNFSAVTQDTVVRLGRATNTRLTVITPEGWVIADSEEQPAVMDNHSQRPEIIEARDSGIGTASRFSQTQQQMSMYRAIPVMKNQQLLGFVRAAVPLTTVDQQLAQLQRLILLSASIVAIAALLLGLYFVNRVTGPLRSMTEAAEAICKGDYNRRIEVVDQDEIGSLAAAFNRMARRSAQRMGDITRDRNRLSSIFAGMVEGVVDVDEDQKIVHINQVAAELLGLSINGSIGKSLWEEVRVTEIITALEQTLETQKVVNTQMRRPSNEDDQVVNIYAAALQNEQGDSIGEVIVLNNISKLDQLERIRRDFVANASHELKTPITAIRGLTETILDDEKMAADIRQGFMEKVHAQSIRLSSLVTDLMTISRLESDHQDKSVHAFDLGELVRRSMADCTALCQEKQLQTELSLPDSAMIINGDAQAISQLVDNLIDNAIKYTENGGTVSVKLEKENNTAKFTVEDSGIGINPQDQQRIFERFYRVDKARSRELGGTGLGLSIVKNIAEEHDGNVTVASNPGMGSTFTITLPLNQKQSQAY